MNKLKIQHVIPMLLVAVVVAVSGCMLTGCNKALFDTNYTFKKAIVTLGDRQIVLDVKSWTDYEGEQIQVTTTDGRTFLFSSFNCILTDCDNINDLRDVLDKNN